MILSRHRIFANILVTFSTIIALTFIPSGLRVHAMEGCNGIGPGTKIYWGKQELKIGQIGRLNIIKNTPLYKLEGEVKQPVRMLKAGENYRIYAFKPGKLSVGGGLYADRDTRVAYSTPSKVKLLQLKCKKDAVDQNNASIKLGEAKESVEAKFGKEKRITTNEYNTNWFTYHNAYKKFYMISYLNNKISSLFTMDENFYLQNIHVGSNFNEVKSYFGVPLKGILKGNTNYLVLNNNEQQTFLKDGYYITIFYDRYNQGKVTGIQAISAEMERKKEGHFGKVSTALQQSFELQMFDLLNAARVKNGLSVLNWGEKARTSSRKHSLDMAEHNFFDHINLNGESPFDRMKAAGISYRVAGENIAMGYSSSIFAHEAFMNSIGHRENILKPEYSYAGIGVQFQAGTLVPYYTQNFYKPF